MFSSISSVIGNKGQANYAAANEYLDALVVERQRLNLPSLSVNIGSIVDVGVVAQDKRLRKMMEAQGVYGITSTSIFTNLEVILATENAPRRVILQPAMWKGIYDNFETMKTQIAHLVRYQDASDTNAGELTEENKKEKLLTFLSELLHSEKEGLILNTPLSHYGVDSLMAIEIKNFMQAKFNTTVSQLEILNSATIASLLEKKN